MNKTMSIDYRRIYLGIDYRRIYLGIDYRRKNLCKEGLNLFTYSFIRITRQTFPHSTSHLCNVIIIIQEFKNCHILTGGSESFRENYIKTGNLNKNFFFKIWWIRKPALYRFISRALKYHNFSNRYFLLRFISVYQKPLKRTFKVGLWVQNPLLSLCSCEFTNIIV